LAAPLGRAWWHVGKGEDRGCVVGLEVLFIMMILQREEKGCCAVLI
jgi:hypothetical protein